MKQKVKNTIKKGKIILKNKRRENIYTKKIKNIIKHINLPETVDGSDIKKYWSKLGFSVNPEWHKAYISVNGKYDYKYITETLFYNYIEPFMNDTRLMLAYSDKNSYSKILKNADLPETIIKRIKSNYFDQNDNIIDVGAARKILVGNDDRFIIKPSLETGGGKGVNLVKINNSNMYVNENIISFKKLTEQYDDFVVQRVIEQHKVLCEVYPHSLNTIRIMTLRYDKKINILSSVARFGNKGAVIDNQASGGISCGVDKNGNLNNYAVSKYGEKYYSHPFTGTEFDGIKIPNYELICEKVKMLHEQLPYFDLISWDVAIDSDGKVIIIELNLQGQEINFHQFNNGPLFGKYTENVIEKLYNSTGLEHTAS